MYFQSLLLLGGLGYVSAKTQYMGINIAGFEFGCATDGTCPTSSSQGPLSSLGHGDGAGQMSHFVTDDGANMFRLPVSWQYLLNNAALGSTLSTTNLANYDLLMQDCLSTGAYCMIDIHNFARYNGNIIGQSTAVTDAHFVSLWTQLATKYASNSKIVFELMNEPHDLDITIWAATCQAAVAAIRNAGATSQMILLPGTNYASASQFVSSGSGAALIGITNPDGTTDNLILDLHKYLDEDNSGTHSACVTDNIADAFALCADFLRINNRLALVSETGASSDSSCVTDFCAQNTYLNENSDVFLGYVAWAAGSFASSYLLSLTPSKVNGKYVDNAIASQCVVSVWANAGSATFTASATPAVSGTTLTSVIASSSSVVSSSAVVSGSAIASSAPISSASGSTKTTAKARVSASNSTASAIQTGIATSYSNGTVATTISGSGNATKTAGGSAGSGASATSTSTQVVVSSDGAEMRRFTAGLLVGSLLVAVLL